MITITIDGRGAEFPEGTTLKQAVGQLTEHPGNVLGAMNGGVVLELNAPLTRSVSLKALTYADDEGRRIYERSLRFVMLMAARRVWPEHQVRIEHSLGYGLYVTVRGHVVTREELRRLEREMHQICRADLPYTIERWTRSQAVEYYRSLGQEDTVRLLKFRPYQHLYMYTCQDVSEYFYGKMLPSTGYSRVFALKLNKPGFILQMPKPAERIEGASAAAKLPKHLATFKESNEWCRILRCTDVADLNEMILNSQLRTFIRVNEALQDKSIAHIADQISRRHSRAVFIAGPSSSGKTTFANRLGIHLRVLGLQPMLISLDDFYRPRAEIPRQENGEYDFESLGAMNVKLLNENLNDLIAGREVIIPKFDFKSGKTIFDESRRMKLEPGDMLFMEGIHALNPALTPNVDRSRIYNVYISALSALPGGTKEHGSTTDKRLLRRIVRDNRVRGISPEDNILRWPSVRRGEARNIFPFEENARVVFNSSTLYDIPLLKYYAEPLLYGVTEASPAYKKAQELLKFIEPVIALKPAEIAAIPPTSIMREFIGGQTL